MFVERVLVPGPAFILKIVVAIPVLSELSPDILGGFLPIEVLNELIL
jgi:hypothetical protein